MNNKERLDLAKWVISEAQKNGADEAAVDIANTRDIEVSIRERKLEELNESKRNYLSLTIYANKRYSSNDTNDLRRESLGKFIGEMVAMTKYLSEDEFRSLPDPKYYQGQKTMDLQAYDPYYNELTSNKRIEIAKTIEDAALSKSDKIISCTSGFSDSHAEMVKVHSNGFEGNREGTAFSTGASVTIDDGTGGRPQDWAWVTVRHFKDLPSLTELGYEATARALNQIGQSKIESGKYEMLVENRTAARLLYAMFGPLSGRALQQKSSYLENKIGEKIGSDKFTIIDDPFIPKGLGSRLYNDEGMATKKRVIIDKGVLKTYLIDDYYGKKLGMEPTGGSTCNILYENGTLTLDDMIKKITKGIYVTSFIGGNSNSTTGDYSYGIIGQLIENGKIVKAVNEMNISGNLSDLWNQLTEVGNDPYMYSSIKQPSLYFKEIQFSGV